ncbi:sensor histidine kinase [Variovorax sp. dw_308]|uniref:sensor histidine kinase n=1 Tax=Variovorax sp. dw_308 TaxID=2721546 RepID=UPI001C49315B|nr:histidine kinase [Variovorax sp. dw_308]
MAGVPFQRHRSWFENVAIWLTAGVACALMLASFESLWLFFLESFSDAWPEFAWCFLRALVAVAALLLVLRLGTAWLPERRALRWPALALVIFTAAAAGWFAEDGLTLVLSGEPVSDGERPYMLHTMFVLALLVGVLGEYRWASLRAAAALHEAELNRVRLESELAAGRLQVLQAQIEPHFLFNSLANVRRLLRTDGRAGRAMLVDLMLYLESALPRMRGDSSTLAREAELIRAFLAVHQVRMGARLQFHIDVPHALGRHIVPPMMLLTLIENALKHGLSPLAEGGSISIVATEANDMLVLQVADTGHGLVPGSGGGTGLANIRARLRAMYGAAAGLSLQLNQPRGVVAQIHFPVHAV